AQTPLLISPPPPLQSNLFHILKQFLHTLKHPQHFKLHKNKKQISLTKHPIHKPTNYFKLHHFYHQINFHFLPIINLSLTPNYLFHYNLHYLLSDPEILFVRTITPPILPPTKLHSPFHQPIQPNQHLQLSIHNTLIPTITFQNLFKLFHKFPPITPTPKQPQNDFFHLYSKILLHIPTHKPIH
ncbi:preprotein translocase subunit SecA, partial [Staphylococcus capitis]